MREELLSKVDSGMQCLETGHLLELGLIFLASQTAQYRTEGDCHFPERIPMVT